MEIGLMVEPQVGGTYPRLLELAKWAEAEGFDAFARSDHYLSSGSAPHVTDALTSFGGLAAETSVIRLTVLVTPITFRHPAVIAKTAGTLNEMSGARFELGVGTGWMELEHEAFGIALPAMGLRYSRFEEALEYLWAAFGRTAGGFSGEHFTLADIDVVPSVGQTTPIVIGGSGAKKTPTLAGRYADEYNVFTMAKAPLEARVGVMRAAAKDAGRDAGAIKVSMAVNPIVADDEAAHRELLAERAAARNIEVDEYVAMLDDRHIPHGTADRVASQFAAIASWGVGRVYLQQFAALDEIDTDLVGQTAALIRGL